MFWCKTICLAFVIPALCVWFMWMTVSPQMSDGEIDEICILSRDGEVVLRARVGSGRAKVYCFSSTTSGSKMNLRYHMRYRAAWTDEAGVRKAHELKNGEVVYYSTKRQ